MMSSTSPKPAATPAGAHAARMHWMDMLRGVAVLLVVILHGADVPLTNGNGIPEWSRAQRYLEPFRMPLLMFLSGMLLPHSLTKPIGTYAAGKLRGLGWPTLLWLVLFGVLIYRGGPLDPNYWIHGDYLWFLMMLCMCYLIGSALHPLAGRRVWLPAAALLIAVAMLTALHVSDFPGNARWLYYPAFFFIGAAAARLVPRWFAAPWLLVAALAVVVGYLSHLGVDDRTLRVGSIYSVPAAVLGIAVVLWGASRTPLNSVTRFFTWAGRNSIVVYVVHFPVIVLIHRLMQYLGVDPVTHVTACTVGGLVITLLVVRTRALTPWLYEWPRRTPSSRA